MFNLSINNSEILVGKRRGRLFAFKNSCPHRGASLSKGDLNGDYIVCYMHGGYEFNLFTGNLEHMKSCKKDEKWIEHNAEWRKSGNLALYPVIEKEGSIYIEEISK
jgi:nitrite reductase/ring-hydroxylating ferredoxin subunit